MSVTLMALSWKTALPMNAKMALLALSDWANDEGGNIHPSIYSLAEKLSCSERTAQRVLRDLERDQWIAVVGNHNGGVPGATRRYRLNVRKLQAHAAQEDARRQQERKKNRHRLVEEPDPFADQDGCQFDRGDKLTGVTNTTETGDKSGGRRVTNTTETGDTGVTLSTIDPSIEPSVEPPYSAPHSRRDADDGFAVVPVARDAKAVAKAKRGKSADPAKPGDVDALQAACRTTWQSYSDAHQRRYGTKPVRNAKVNANVRQLVQRLGEQEAPAVAAFFVDCVNDAFVVRACHGIGLLLAQAEGYRTQWASGRAMTATRARQIDQTQSNADAASEAIAMLRAKRAGQSAPADFVDVEARPC